MKLNQSKKTITGKSLKIAIILPRFNDDLGNQLLQNTVAALKKHGVAETSIVTYRVPGALELPFAAQKIATNSKYNRKNPPPSAIIALGIVIRGETAHFDLVVQESYRGLMDVSLKTHIPVIFGILAVENKKQALDRIEASRMDKGTEFARCAIEMARFVA